MTTWWEGECHVARVELHKERNLNRRYYEALRKIATAQPETWAGHVASQAIAGEVDRSDDGQDVPKS